ncbi:MAG: PepSY-like domain-containing protein [Mediterranea sp.]|jgi:type 1 fimbria pilin|nr:PepSY-like domain-containing protein [Mediterranea sp.]
MKRLKILSMVAGLFFIQAAAAQSPAISTRYSNEEIVQKIKAHKASHSQDVVPPANLQQKFGVDFPKASDVEWETTGDIYEVEFDVRLRDCKAYYDATGNLLMTIEETYRSELPAIVKNAAEAKYPKYHFEDINKIRRGTEVFYEVEMELRDMEVELLIQPNGTILNERIDY